jgi:hypothetical protein
MVSEIITSVFEVVEAVLGGFGSTLTTLIELIYVDGGLTEFGSLVLLVAAVPLAWGLLTYIVTFFKKATKIK